MTCLSPKAQAVLDAFTNNDTMLLMRPQLAAALRAAADQLINVKWSVEMQDLHHEFHVIATELEAL